MINFISKIKNVIKLKVISNKSEPKILLYKSRMNKQKKVTFRVDSFTAKNLEGLISQSNLSISIFVKTALYNHISFYKELNFEPFEIGHWLDDAELKLTYTRFTITLDDTLSNEFNRLESVYKANGLTFNKSYFIRCAVINRLHNIILEEANF